MSVTKNYTERGEKEMSKKSFQVIRIRTFLTVYEVDATDDFDAFEKVNNEEAQKIASKKTDDTLLALKNS